MTSASSSWRSSKVVILGVLTATALATGAAHAKDAYPTRPITLVVPFAAGGGTDVVARLIAKRMGEELNSSIVVENKPGAGGSVGTGTVARAAPDGYTILMGTASTHAINPALHKNLPYSPQQDFVPVSLLVTVPHIVAVNTNSPYKTFAELLDGMRDSKDGLTYGSQGVGGTSHLIGNMVDLQAKVKSIHVPYKGAAPAVQDLIAGNIDLIYDTPPGLLPHIQGGSLRALAVLDDTPVAQLPGVPVAADLGMAQLKAITWNALFAPKGTPAEAVEALAQAAHTAMQDPELVERLQALSAQPVGSTPDALRTFNQTEADRWHEIIQTANIRLD